MYKSSASSILHRIEKGSILVAETHACTADVVSRILARSGYGVRVANHREEAIGAVQMNSYDVILLDYQMSGPDACSFVRTVRRFNPRAVIVLMTAGAEVGQRAEELDIHCWIAKPFSAEELLETLTVIQDYWQPAG